MLGPGDHHALEALYRSRFDVFLRIALSTTRDESLAYDAVQEGFVRALRSFDGFRGDAPLEVWVWRIVLNAAHDLRPRRQVELVAEPGEQAEMSIAESSSSGEFASWLAVLPERQRMAVFLRYGADLDYRSIALVLGVEIGTVSATLHAARQTLEELLQEVRQ
jgi:RNA polymerase sigma-70 factor, ECF subfamily